MRRNVAWFVLSLLAAPASWAACMDVARTEYEQLYCKIALTAEGQRLPSFEAFRRNTPTIQAILLKRPAQRLGLTVPPAPNERPIQNPPAPRPQPVTAPAPTPRAAIPPPKPAPAAPSVSDCQLQKEIIVCADRRYRLVNNLANRSLAADALGPDNRLQVPAFSGDVNDKSALKGYLADTYQAYIEKMLTIGLGASTMSYTKFHYTYLEVANQRQDFSARLATMFEYLKKDKANMAVKPRYANELPERIDQCVDLSEELVVCDNGLINWVYRLP